MADNFNKLTPSQSIKILKLFPQNNSPDFAKEYIEKTEFILKNIKKINKQVFQTKKTYKI
jgi:hypothetical protein